MTTFSFNDAYRLINNVITEKINQMIKSGAGIEVTWGTIASDDGGGLYSVYLYGDTVASSGFRAEDGRKFLVTQPVRVSIDRRGNRWINAATGLYAASTNVVSFPASTIGEEYPTGLSVSLGTIADGFPMDFATVMTYKWNMSRMYQEATTHQSGLKYDRMYNNVNGWTAWRRTDSKLRFVPIAESTLYSSATDSSGVNTEVAKTVEATALPSTLTNMYAVGRLLAKHTAAPALVGHYIRVNHYGGSMGGITYAVNPTQWTAGFYIAKTGGTNGRQLQTLIHPGSSGTLTFHQTVTGYFTDDT